MVDIALPRVVPTGVGSIGVGGLTGAPGAGRSAGAALSIGPGPAQSSSSVASVTSPTAALSATTSTNATSGLGLAGVAPATDDGSSTQNVMQSFSAVLAQAMQDVTQTQQAADDGAAKLAAGEPVDLHQVMIGMESANLSLGLALQVRNKLLDAYQEVMRMTI